MVIHSGVICYWQWTIKCLSIDINPPERPGIVKSSAHEINLELLKIISLVILSIHRELVSGPLMDIKIHGCSSPLYSVVKSALHICGSHIHRLNQS